MIDIGKILKRAWHILWDYKVLWIFGILLAMTAGGGGGNGGSNYQFGGEENGQPYYNPEMYNNPQLREFFNWVERDIAPLFENPAEHIATFIWIGVAFFLFVLILGVIFAFIRYTSEAAILRMVDNYEQTGEKVGFKAGWKLGWTKRAFRMWLIDFIIGLPAFLFLMLLVGLGILFFVSVVNGNDALAAGGAIAAIGCTFLFVFAFIVVMVFLSLLRQFFVRKAALEETTVGQSFREGWAMFKRNWKSAALMWLVMLGIGFGFGIASMILFFLLIPVYIILIIPALLVAAIPGLIAFGIASLFAGTVLAAIIGGLVALPFFFTVLFAPLTLISGWYMIFDSSVWTLTYREMKALEGLAPAAEAEAPAVTE
jgi:hypothetical protein